MKKIGIITINDDNNYGNRLQNYAVQEIIKKFHLDAISIKNVVNYNSKNIYLYKIKKILKIFMKKKSRKFFYFNKNIKTTSRYIYINYINKTLKNKYDYFVAGSDQIWNYNFNRLSNIDLLDFANDTQKIAFSASFGVGKLPEKYKNKVTKALSTFKSISVREDSGKKIVEELTGRKDVEVLVDPTMLLTAEEWDKVSLKPKQINKLNGKKYILNYFLGELSEERKKEIERVAKENNCEIINIMDKKDPFYVSGPSEFLYLEKNAFLICTDSFHSSVFAILYDRPFVVFDREEKGMENMGSRLDTLINKFHLKNRRFTGKITKENLEHDYTEAYKILEEERKKSDRFLRKALEIKKKNEK